VQRLWNNLTKIDEEEGQQVNLVIFFQKELWDKHGNFFFGKMKEFVLDPLQPSLLKCHYLNLFGSAFPFEKPALKELAVMSRGVFRRFKNYVGICLDNIFSYTITLNPEQKNSFPPKESVRDSKKKNRREEKKKSTLNNCNCVTVTVEDVRRWITLDQLVKDMTQELLSVFPKNRELQRKTVLLLRRLTEKPLLQSEIVKVFFDGKKANCSRFLAKLESWGYITRKFERKVKVVKLKEVS